MIFSRTIKLLALTGLLLSCSIKSDDLIPCMCDNEESTLGVLNCMCEPFSKRPVKKLSYIQDNVPIYETIDPDDEQRDAYLYLHRKRSDFAPVQLEYVDFRIKKENQYSSYNTKLGNYRFRIFGCRREAKNIYLNKGRAMQKDMRFFDIFFETMNEYYPVVVEKTNANWARSDKAEFPEYILTAEITDYFMNICDAFDWDKSKSKDRRTGSSEITVTWRLMDITKENVYCKVTTTGYGEVIDGEYNGETLLIERAFQDALSKLPTTECYNGQLSQRVDIKKIKRQVIQEEIQTIFQEQYAPELKAIEVLQSCTSGELTTTEIITDKGEPKTIVSVLSSDASLIQETGDVTSKGSAEVIETLIIDSLGSFDESGDVNSSTSLTDETGGIKSAGSSSDFNVIDKGCNAIKLADGNISTGAGVTADGGSCIITNIDEKVTVKDDFWLEIPLDEAVSKEETKTRNKANDLMTKNSFCIQNNEPYDKMTPENLFKVRTAVVEVENSNGDKGAGLIISNQLILTSADLLIKQDNSFDIKTIKGLDYKARALRVNPNKNVALLLLDTPTYYRPLPLDLELPEVNKDTFMTLGLLGNSQSEGYLDNKGKVIGYRYSEEKGAEIIVDTFVQNYTLGGALIDQNGNIVGLAHSGKKLEDGPDLFIPIETGLTSLGVSICGHTPTNNKKPVALKAILNPISTAIENNSKHSKDPKVMNKKERK